MKFLNIKFVIIMLLFFLYVFICSYFYVCQVSYNLADSVFRLHIIANSNLDEDQNLKYVVRDKLIEYMNSICSNSNSKDETIEIVKEHISEFEEIANNVIKENGFSYTASVEVGNFEFPTKVYSDISFPAGYYDALEVKIGKAEGNNWWCVLYPSLCFIDDETSSLSTESKEELQETLGNEEYELISENDSISLNFKFKLIEFFNNNNIITAKNSNP